MAYDPVLTSFIIVGLVGGVAVVMSVAPGWEMSHELGRATDGWTLPVVTRIYRGDAIGGRRRIREAAILDSHGYREVLQRETGEAGDVHEPPLAHGPMRAQGPPAVVIVVTYQLA